MAERARAVLLDWNGTVNDLGVIAEQDIHVGRVEFGVELTEADVRAAWGVPVEQLMPRLFGRGGDSRSWQQMYAIFQGYNDQFPRRILRDVVPVLDVLRRTGIVTGLVTTSPRNMVNFGMQSGRLPHGLFDILHTREDLLPNQPTLSRAIGELALRGISPRETIYVGDEAVTISDAEAVGANYVVVASGTRTREQLLHDGVPEPRLISRLGELLGRLDLPEEPR